MGEAGQLFLRGEETACEQTEGPTEGWSPTLSLKPSGGVARCGSKALKSSYSLEGARPPCLTKDSCIPVHMAPVWVLKRWSI